MAEGMNFAAELRKLAGDAGSSPPDLEWKAGDYLYRQGFPTEGLIVLSGGLTKASILAVNGTEVLVCLMGPGRILGDLEYFLGRPAQCSVVALEPVRGTVYGDRLIQKLRREATDFDFLLGRTLAIKLAENAERFERNFCYPLDYNILVAARCRLGAPDRSVRKEELQEYLGVSGRHLNRVLAGLAEEGLIRVEAGRVVVVDEASVNARIERTEAG